MIFTVFENKFEDKRILCKLCVWVHRYNKGHDITYKHNTIDSRRLKMLTRTGQGQTMSGTFQAS